MLRKILCSTNACRLVSIRCTNSRGSSLDIQQCNVIDYDDPQHLPQPEYPMRPNEPLTTRKQRLIYQSRKRGMLENDLILSSFAAKYLQNFNASQTAQYDELINGVSNDWEIYYWATGTKPAPPQFDTEIMQLLKEHVKNVERVQRLRQPNLH
ncbi:succinate dehydrogenase assembly factor 2-A, mitochondrial [Scaptodrosophila lebanonensis]|uniref:Succinate dehydrogenase assembly factor 2, mitochondrial n=1 Tax=Drosophila lebanonensis TaxID=7225 RepID=A0A6J2TG79_DROLE|nr:succinate dehydrogenase assembly factor 2-A, mitochondrial [Scaptodrosophila lebanonensis]